MLLLRLVAALLPTTAVLAFRHSSPLPLLVPSSKHRRWASSTWAATSSSSAAPSSAAAPRLSGEALADWQRASGGAPMADKGAVLRESFVHELLEEGDLEMSEVDDIWEKCVGAGAEAVDEAAFSRFWHGVDALFDGEEEEEDVVGQVEDDDDEEEEEEEYDEPGEGRLEEVWLDPSARERLRSGRCSIGECIRRGEVVVKMSGAASRAELRLLLAAAMRARDRESEAASQPSSSSSPPSMGRSRFSVSDPAAFPEGEVVMAAEEVLLRVVDAVDERLPSVYGQLFGDADGGWTSRQPLNAQGKQPTTPPPAHLLVEESVRGLYMAGELEWSEGEPAINVYEASGQFGAHKDHLALTVLLPLTAPAAGVPAGGAEGGGDGFVDGVVDGVSFSGGGTGFWAGNRAVDENPTTPPTAVLRPPLGTALIFGGDVTHAGMPVQAGLRSVLVASFSTRTAESPPDRVHGLQEPPAVSPGFKGG